jgi:hypothetical protein
MVADSSVADFGISCEACHGPGREHVEFHQNAVNRYRHHLSGEPDPTIVNPARCTKEASVMICARCHSSSQPHDRNKAWMEGIHFRPGPWHASQEMPKSATLLSATIVASSKRGMPPVLWQLMQ